MSYGKMMIEMEPLRDTRVTLVDLLDRALEKGLLINADLVISVAGVPLIGVKLSAAIASVETLLKYGIMGAWCVSENGNAVSKKPYSSSLVCEEVRMV